MHIKALLNHRATIRTEITAKIPEVLSYIEVIEELAISIIGHVPTKDDITLGGVLSSLNMSLLNTEDQRKNKPLSTVLGVVDGCLSRCISTMKAIFDLVRENIKKPDQLSIDGNSIWKAESDLEMVRIRLEESWQVLKDSTKVLHGFLPSRL